MVRFVNGIRSGTIPTPPRAEQGRQFGGPFFWSNDVSLETIHLRKLLKFFALNDERARSALRREHYEDRRRAEFPNEGGGDFHAPFWSDAKSHVSHGLDLGEATEIRIERNDRRSRLYPIMTDRFLAWWQIEQRGTNEVLRPLDENVHGRLTFADLQMTVKVDNLMSFQVGVDGHRLIYPYFSETPALNEHWGRLALWVMGQVLTSFSVEDGVVLDLHRSASYRTHTHALWGDENARFAASVRRLQRIWDEITAEA